MFLHVLSKGSKMVKFVASKVAINCLFFMMTMHDIQQYLVKSLSLKDSAIVQRCSHIFINLACWRCSWPDAWKIKSSLWSYLCHQMMTTYVSWFSRGLVSKLSNDGKHLNIYQAKSSLKIQSSCVILNSKIMMSSIEAP